jgi:maltoporin
MARTDAISKGLKATSLTNPTSATVFKSADNASYAAFVRVPGFSGDTDKVFRLRARGRATTGTTSNFKATLQYSSDITSTAAATATNNTDFYALTNRSLATITRFWKIECVVAWDSTSQRMVGQDEGSFNGETIETSGAIITALTAIDLSTGKCGFVVSTIFGSTNASNVATLDELTLEVM